jgi:drug/metabolite transporter (DMT)-like permease
MNTPSPHIKLVSSIALVASIAFGIAGQLLMKSTMSTNPETFLTGTWLFQLIFALSVYSCGVASWVIALRYFKLSIAYPLTSLNYIGILVGSYYFFHEQITFTRIVGVLLIFIGVLLVVVPFKQSRDIRK